MRKGDGNISMAPWLDQPPAEPVRSRHRGEGAAGPRGCFTSAALGSQHGPMGTEAAMDAAGCWGASSPHAGGGGRVGTAPWGDATAGRWGYGRAGGAGLSLGAGGGCRWRGAGMLSRCYQSVAALLSAAASPECKSERNKAEDFSARSGLTVSIRSGDSVTTGKGA